MKTNIKYSAMLYELAEEIRREEGCVTVSPELIDEAAERFDVQTLAISMLFSTLEELEKTSARGFLYDDPVRKKARELIAAIRHGQPEKQPETESAPAIVFFPAGSLGEEIEEEGRPA